MKQLALVAVPVLIAAACSGGDQRGPTAPEYGASSVRQTAASIAVAALPSLGGSSTARAINDDQVIVGSSNGLPVKWTLDASGHWVIEQLQATSGQAEDVTESGVIVGTAGGSVILWSPGAAPETIGPGYAEAVNESQVVVGEDNSAADGNGARAWTRSGTGWVPHVLPREAGFAGGYQAPLDINDDGIIVGYAADAGSAGTRPVKWVPSVSKPGEWDPAVPLDDVAAANLGGANAIVGQDIVGEILRCFPPCASPTRDPYHWSLTAGQGIGSLGTEDAWAAGLNAQRSIVGSMYYRGLHAFVWTVANPTIRDLGAPHGYQSASAYDINNPTEARRSSQAVGQASSRKGVSVAVLWTIP